jgi:hypothetical protein
MRASDADRSLTDRFSDSFLDDYFAECGEHLRGIRGALLTQPAIAVTGYARPEDRARALSAG